MSNEKVRLRATLLLTLSVGNVTRNNFLYFLLFCLMEYGPNASFSLWSLNLKMYLFTLVDYLTKSYVAFNLVDQAFI